ncbi:aminobenzoyl-glutamate transport protein [Marinococcus luteus]|uniref:Aminobenzoyl-glutamate transport protein n=1 Tax=Marinococcus luteus TaxID=1122204 RepID=A0A1H2XR91_9BACI|nr:AbgT family transporter [Marinococcus luteus]SDW94849.1 aminobenzoyl-glutamate transport protein [Marinococcus luteus]
MSLENGKKSVFMKFLDGVERAGNKLPHPFMLFIYLAAAVILISSVVGWAGVSFEDPQNGETVAVQPLISEEGLEYILSSMLDNFTGFAPLGLVLVMMLGIGLAQKVGLMETFMTSVILKAPKKLVTYAVIGTGIIGNLASDAAFVIIPPLAAMVFYALGRHPLAGIAAGFAGVGAGFTANIIITGTDALLSGISTEAAQTVNESANVTPVDNWYYMIASVPMLMIVGAWLTERVIEPRLGIYDGSYSDGTVLGNQIEEITPERFRGMRNAGIAGAVYLVLIAIMVVPANGLLRGENGAIVESPFISNIVPLILFFFIIVAVAYGVTTKVINSTSDVPEFMAQSMKDMAGYITLIFAAAQFIAYFEWTNLSSYMAVSGANFLTAADFSGLPVVVGFILLAGVLNMFIFSGSAQWALMAPIFIPLFMYLDYNPAYIQLAYRLADSTTNVITPLNPYVPMILAFMKQYDHRAGFGTLFSIMLPYTLVFLTLWIVMFIVWNLLGLPIGPGVYMDL